MSDDHLTQVFFDVQRGLPRQGVGSDELTLRALALCAALPPEPDVLDIGCGPGAQTVVLARATGGRVTAVDTHAEFLGELRMRAARAGVAERITVQEADMRALPFASASFDLLWCEGAAYLMGISEALVAWRPLLRPSGYLAFSEIVWISDERPADVVDFLADYPGMTDVEGNLARIEAAGYETVGHFALPESAWWDEYYVPLEAKLPGLLERYASDPDALGVVESTRGEIELRRKLGHAYGYAFFVTRLRAG